jgi:two-component system, NarL family, invasion response regulator UvrY
MTLRVLVADDQAPFRKAARSLIAASAGLELVGEAMSGEQAVRLAEELHPDLVLMDIKMDGLGGIAAARTIASTQPGTATILVSTYREDELPAEARTCGAVGYLHKAELGAPAITRLLQGRGGPLSPACGPRSPRRGRA